MLIEVEVPAVEVDGIERRLVLIGVDAYRVLNPDRGSHPRFTFPSDHKAVFATIELKGPGDMP